MKALATALRTQAAARAERFEREQMKQWPRPRYPHREELVYYRRLRYFVELVQYIVERDIVPNLPALLDEQAPTVTLRRDSADDIDRAFQAAALAATKGLPEKTIEAAAQSTALRVSEWSADQFQQQVQRVVKVNLYDDTSGLAEHLDLFVSDNVKLIKSLTGNHLSDVKGIVTRGARAGLHHVEVSKQIQQQFGVTKRRAALIASDQIGKLNGELNQLRQTNLGVRRYRWSTSLDERVRKTHRALEGSIQEWARPPEVDPRTGERGHPGQPIRCRCSAIPILDDVLADAGLIDPGDVETAQPRRGEQPPLRTPPAILPRTSPPPTPKPPTPPPVPPPPVSQRTEPAVDPRAALAGQVPTLAKAGTIEARIAAEHAAGRARAEEAADLATVEAAREWVRQARAAKRAALGKPPPKPKLAKRPTRKGRRRQKPVDIP
jgi:SPP1 gp7 family putative phage head morphogenesis protein